MVCVVILHHVEINMEPLGCKEPEITIRDETRLEAALRLGGVGGQLIKACWDFMRIKFAPWQGRGFGELTRPFDAKDISGR